MENNDKLYNWVFHFNNHDQEWSAIPRHLYNDYWSNRKLDGILRSKKINTLIEWIYKEAPNVRRDTNLR